VLCIAIVILCTIYGQITTKFNVAGQERTIIAFALGIIGSAVVFVFPKFDRTRSAIITIFAVCVAARLALIPTAASDDISRYLWEGKLTAEGVSPYQGKAFDDVFIEYRDSYWEKMNHRDKLTAYPPLAMQAFRAINWLGYTPLSYKWVFLLLDLAVVGMLMLILRHHQLPIHWVLFYGLSPLTLLSFSAEAHFDIVMVAAFTLALLAYSKKWIITCGVAVGLAVGAKIMAAVIAPILLWKTGWKGITAGLITLLIPLLFNLDDLQNMFSGLFAFGSGGGFNSAVHQFLKLFISAESASLCITVLYALTWFFAFWVMLKGNLWSALLIAFGGLLVLSPIIHFWYLTWVLPLIALRPKLSWVTLSTTFSLYLLVWKLQAETGSWIMPDWAKWMFWLPFVFFLITESKYTFKRLKYRGINLRGDKKMSWSIVIPTYQPSPEQLTSVLESISKQTLPVDEVIISIKSGVEAATKEWVMIVHSDIELPYRSMERVSSSLERNPQFIGGALGQRFNGSSPGLLLVEAMNEFRATLLSTSFGDQSQFFHRETAVNNGVLTEQKLMEDVEMS